MTPSAQPLPPALARLASALELSSGFLLYFLTGPRDHADSVYLRLRALDPDFELVRHRIRSATDLELADLLSNSADERPRVVFLSGLETLDTATRRELSERLNLLRDSWAPHPARVVFWLPSWGLAEFRRIAPDLFDWRSGLITLNDADLPIRSELEYLVWACERHDKEHFSLDSLRRRRHLPYQLEQAPTLAVLTGLDPTERHHILRDLVTGFAGAALPTDHRGLSSVDLDVHAPLLHRHGPVLGRPDRDGVHHPVPVLVRSQEAAGRFLPDLSPWQILARVAGLPGESTSAAVLAEVAAEGRLLLFLDGFDQLSLEANNPAQHWLEWLLAATPPIRVVAAVSGPPAGLFAHWPLVPLGSEHILRDDILDQHFIEYQRLIQLVQALFRTSEDLATLARYLLGPEADDLHFQGAHHDVATRLILACARRGLLDASFFAELTRMRPAHTAEIEAIARSLTSP